MADIRVLITRPEGQADKLKKLFEERRDIYHAAADLIVPDMESPEKEAEMIIARRMEMIL